MQNKNASFTGLYLHRFDFFELNVPHYEINKYLSENYAENEKKIPKHELNF